MSKLKYPVSDLILFYESPFAYWCKTLNKLIEIGEVDESKLMSITESNLHSEQFLKKAEKHEIKLKDHYLFTENKELVDISTNSSFEKTLEHISKKVDLIYQGSIESSEFTARPDFLVLDENNIFYVVDAKYSKSIKDKYELQVYCYASILYEIQGTFPKKNYIYLINNEFVEVEINKYEIIFNNLKNNFIKFNETFDIHNPPHPQKSENDKNIYSDEIKKIWVMKNSLELINGITYKQVNELNTFGIKDLEDFSKCENNPTSIKPTTFTKLQKKANAILKNGENIYYEINYDSTEDLLNVPEHTSGDLYIDFEWYPYSGELENFFYLFGLYEVSNNEGTFLEFWSNHEDEEELNTKKFIDYLLTKRNINPEIHIFHYNHSERTELLKLAKKYDYRIEEIENIIEENFVDLRTPVKNSFYTGLSSNSLKEVEKILDLNRNEEVTSGGQSMKYFEDFYFEDDFSKKNEIVEYNFQDCKNLNVLHHWLVEQKLKLSS